jgi:hypothetical protein
MAEMFQELIQDAIDQGALEMLKAQIMNSIMAATGMVPGVEGGEEGGGAVQSAGGSEVTSAGEPAEGAMGPQVGGVLPEQLYNELVTKAYGTKMAQRRAPESNQGD